MLTLIACLEDAFGLMKLKRTLVKGELDRLGVRHDCEVRQGTVKMNNQVIWKETAVQDEEGHKIKSVEHIRS